MGKKITLDFSKVEERAGWKTDHVEEGLHEMKVELVDMKDAGDGTAMWTYGLRPTNPKYKTRLFPYYCKHQDNQLFKIRDIFVAAGLNVPKRRQALDPEAPVGKIVAAEVVDSSNVNYQGRSEINGVYDRSIIDDDQVAGDEDEVDEEELDEEADEVEDDEDEVEELDEDELREEIEALTLGELRKRAKGLEIDTAGVSKKDLIEMVLEEELGEAEDEEADDEDDLDDEDLEDEELEEEEFDDEEDEEEEPEPEPAPRRRPAARKPAAKAAPAKAAPARRVVKRR